jgi:thiol-disulfide isomerase/thioredoxin
MFPMKVVAGDLAHALSSPGDIVLTHRAARQFFGRDDVVGETLDINREHSLRIVAVVEDLPSNSNLTFDILSVSRPRRANVSTKVLARILPVATLSIGVMSFAALHAAEPTFKIGDPAPLIAPVTWLKGSPVTKYDSRRVYVVELWATWCPPCIKMIPHLSALQKQHASTLTIIGVNGEGLLGFEAKANAVNNFMTTHGRDMTYTVAMEDAIGKPISEQWVIGTGLLGAPTAGIVDQHGKLVWIGYPDVAKGYTFEQALEDTLAGKVDLARSRALQIELSHDAERYWAERSHKSS